MRPLLILLIGKMCAGPQEELINLASSIELLHTATLVHDDLIDGSSLRRGVPTLNSHWNAAPTVLTGDFLFSKAASLAAATNDLEVIKLFSKTLAIIVNGELGQLFDGPYNSSLEDYYQRIYAKRLLYLKPRPGRQPSCRVYLRRISSGWPALAILLGSLFRSSMTCWITSEMPPRWVNRWAVTCGKG